ncbi:hypothetical protein [Halomarina ordinaria]|uniref:Uncharacterized protein n=1 Tax=Halomarina ordinaria TaxID=3033939 RepID=A0ABD5U445_9EURY|nr:hypothetical protein [Halomarina sp. PSRA2]
MVTLDASMVATALRVDAWILSVVGFVWIFTTGLPSYRLIFYLVALLVGVSALLAPTFVFPRE